MMRIRLTRALAVTLSCAMLSGGFMPEVYAQEPAAEVVAEAQPSEMFGENPDEAGQKSEEVFINGEESREVFESHNASEGNGIVSGSVYTLFKDEKYDDGFAFLDGYRMIDLNGHTLEISGNKTDLKVMLTRPLEVIDSSRKDAETPGKMIIWHDLIINGDFAIDPPFEDSYGAISSYDNTNVKVTVWGDVFVNAGTFSTGDIGLECSDITFSGDAVCDGICKVNGNMIFNGNAKYNKNSHVFGDIIFNNSATCGAGVTVEGSFVYNSSANSRAGSVEVGGNVTQANGAGPLEFAALSLNGSGRQSLTLQSNSDLGYLWAENTNVAVNGWLNAYLRSDFAPVQTTAINTSALNLGTGKVTFSKGLNVIGDSKKSGNEYYSVFAYGLDDKYPTVVINGDLSSNSGIVLGAETSITVNGNYTQTGGRLSNEIGGWDELIVKGNAHFTGNVEYLNVGIMKVGGSLTIESTGNSYDYDINYLTVGKNLSQSKSSRRLDIWECTLPNAGSSVSLQNGKIINLKLSHPLSRYSITPANCYEHLEAPGAGGGNTSAGWQKKDGKWWYRNSDGSYPKNDWKQIDGEWYYFDKSGWMLTGWQKIGGKWYYLGKDGKMVTGRQSINSKEYLFATSGVMQTGWQKLSGNWHYYDKSGAMLRDWQQIGKKWYCFDAAGAMRTGWFFYNTNQYYLRSSGEMATGWERIDGKWYYFGKSDDGAMKTGWQKIGKKWYYFNKSGVMQTGWKKISKKWYYFKGGVMKTGWLKNGGKWYYLDANGRMISNTSRRIKGKTYRFDKNGVCSNP